MILHVVTDEKFIDMAYRMFETVLPHENHFLFFSRPCPLKYIRSTPVRFVSKQKMFSPFFLKSLEKYDFVVFHALQPDGVRLINRLARSIKVVWIGWGFDYYDLLSKNEMFLFLEKTAALYRHASQEHPRYRSWFKRFRASLARHLSREADKRRAIHRVDFFAPVLDSEYGLLARSIPTFNSRQVRWNYGTLEDDYSIPINDDRLPSDGILIGNSATYTNNHLDIFDVVAPLVRDRRVLCPLSYGDPSYRKAILDAGTELFGPRFHGLTDFLTSEVYISLLKSCSHVVMGHVRQQALGNIVISLYLGAKVFLLRENPVYSFLLDIGVVIYSIEELCSELDSPLDVDAAMRNREKLRDWIGRDVALKRTKELIDLVSTWERP